jgi:hypothetical protein
MREILAAQDDLARHRGEKARRIRRRRSCDPDALRQFIKESIEAARASPAPSSWRWRLPRSLRDAPKSTDQGDFAAQIHKRLNRA